MSKHEDNEVLLDVLGVILAISIIGSIICGILECFGIKTGVVGGVLGAISLLFLAVFVVWQIIKEISK